MSGELILILVIAGGAIAVGITHIADLRRKAVAEMEIIMARRDEERRRYHGATERRKRVAEFWHVPAQPQDVKPAPHTSPSYGHPSARPLPRSTAYFPGADDTQ